MTPLPWSDTDCLGVRDEEKKTLSRRVQLMTLDNTEFKGHPKTWSRSDPEDHPLPTRGKHGTDHITFGLI